MKFRAQVSHPDSVEALNLIEFAFIDDADVRTAYRHFIEAANAHPFSGDRLGERHKALIAAIIRALKLADRLTIEDINRVYFPRSLGLRELVLNAEINERAAALAAQANAQQAPSPTPGGSEGQA